METVTKKDVLQMAATIIAGIFSNPVFGASVTNQWDRQNIITQTVQDVSNALNSIGVSIVDN